MATTTSPLTLYQTTIGKKAVMAITGLMLFGWLVAHMVGNLQVFAGPERLDAYAKWLQDHPTLLWPARIVMLAVVVLHAASAIQLALLARRARPQRYHRSAPQAATTASRTMLYGGISLAAFIVYHLLHFTTGQAHHGFVHGSVYCNVVTAFSIWWVSAIYIVAMIFLGLHLFHGLWSAFQTFGLTAGRWNDRLRKLATLAMTIVVVGNISMPAAVLAGLIPSAGICS